MNEPNPSPPGFWLLSLLVRTHLLQAGRRLLALRQKSRLLTSLIVIFVVGYATLAFWLFGMGLRFVGAFPGLGTLLIERLMFLLFAFLFMLLIFSNLVISYTNLFRNREAAFLATLPIQPATVFQWKLMESTVLASWAFLFLIAPLLAAFGLHARVAWHFYFFAPVLLALFVVLPGVLGAWAATQVARFLDRRLFQVLTAGTLMLLVAGALFWWKAEPATEDLLESRVVVVLDRLLVKTRFAELPFLPSYWLSAGVLQWAEGALTGALFFALVLLSYALFFGSLAFFASGGLFYEALSAVNSRGSAFWQWRRLQAWRRRQNFAGAIGPVDWTISRLRFLPTDVRAMVVKDVRVFWRDTTQWGQTLVLFGLLGVYILNLRQFSNQLSNPFWIHLVSYLNLGACALNLATLTTRFVFPQFSLEGKRVWIVGLSPGGLPRVLWAKYGLATNASLVLTVGLMVLSCSMLRLEAGRTLYFLGVVTVMTFTLNALATGLGVIYPNLKEDHPSRIVSGFGGTLCLVLSFVYILGSVILLAIGTPWPWVPEAEIPWQRVGVCAGLFLTASLLTGALPLSIGLRQVTRFEM